MRAPRTRDLSELSAEGTDIAAFAFDQSTSSDPTAARSDPECRFDQTLN
jgi:hypothetical protein